MSYALRTVWIYQLTCSFSSVRAIGQRRRIGRLVWLPNAPPWESGGRSQILTAGDLANSHGNRRAAGPVGIVGDPRRDGYSGLAGRKDQRSANHPIGHSPYGGVSAAGIPAVSSN